ncbi:MAG: SDR family oxidoreductase [Microscillaceae bacterium]
MKGKICVVTGANSGIGFYTALALLNKGAYVVMVCRNGEKAETARQELIQRSGSEQIAVYLADLGNMADTKKLGQALTARFPVLDVLVNNAGLLSKGYREITREGLEKTFAVNHLGYFILTLYLLPALKAAPQGRIVNVSSEAHRLVRSLNLQNLQMAEGYNSMKAYGLSKLCNILFTRELARQLVGTSVTVNALHPGSVASNFGSEGPEWFKSLFKLGRRFLLSPEQGAATSVFLATNPELSHISGEYFSNSQIRVPSREARNDLKAQQLWQYSLQLSQLNGNGVSGQD